MAKDEKEGTFQFVFLNLKGDQATIQEAVRQAGQILSGMNPAQAPPTKTYIAVPVPSQQLGDGSNGANATGGTNAAGQQVFEVVPEEMPTNDAENGAGPATPAPTKQKQRRAARPPAYMKDLDPNDAEVSLEEFARQKGVTKTSTQFNQYLLIGTWFHKYKNVTEIGPSHIYTSYQLLNWTPPDNIRQPFSDMKKLHHYFEPSPKKNGMWEITIKGINEVGKWEAKSGAEEE
jgi:hypothetical protein